jgi:hypothetical protein
MPDALGTGGAVEFGDAFYWQDLITKIKTRMVLTAQAVDTVVYAHGDPPLTLSWCRFCRPHCMKVKLK